MKEILETLASMASDILGADPSRITEDTLIVDELGADSLDIIEMLARIEDIYGLYIPDSEVIEMKRVGDAVRYIYNNSIR